MQVQCKCVCVCMMCVQLSVCVCELMQMNVQWCKKDQIKPKIELIYIQLESSMTQFYKINS